MCVLSQITTGPSPHTHLPLFILPITTSYHLSLSNSSCTNYCMQGHAGAHTHKAKAKKQSVPLPLSGHLPHAIRHSRNARALSGPLSQCNGLGTRRWTDRTSSACGVGTRSPTRATADMEGTASYFVPQE